MAVEEYKKNGKRFYRYRARVKDPITAKWKELKESNFHTKKEAQIAEEKAKLDYYEGYTDENMSLKSFLEYWLSQKKGNPNIKETTIKKLERNIKGHILPFFKEIKIKDVTYKIYQKFLDHLPVEKGLSYSTSKMNHDLMKEAFKKAVFERKIKFNPAEGAIIKGELNKRKEEEKFIDTDKIDSFLQEVYKDDYIYWIFFKTLIDTGLRKGECGGLTWNDINFKERTISITKSLDFEEIAAGNIEKMYGDGKTHNAIRTITIDQDLVNDLIAYKKWQNENKLAFNDSYFHDYNFVFCRKNGDYLPKSSSFNKFRKALKASNLSLKLQIHSTRHTHAVACFEAGMKESAIAARLGHGGETITKEVYIHISNKLKIADGDKYAEYKKNGYAIK